MLSPTVGRPRKPPTLKVGARIPKSEVPTWKLAAKRSGLSLAKLIVRSTRLEVARIMGETGANLPARRDRNKQ